MTLTHNAQEVLKTIAYMLGEPGEFYIHEVEGENGQGPTLRGLKAHTIPALCARGYVGLYTEWKVTGHARLTDKGFDEAVRLTGGKGLL